MSIMATANKPLSLANPVELHARDNKPIKHRRSGMY
jgi:hypothetical protein